MAPFRPNPQGRLMLLVVSAKAIELLTLLWIDSKSIHYPARSTGDRDRISDG
jgi:hypothetical protein